MNPNFPNLRIKFRDAKTNVLNGLDIEFDLSAISFDLNQTTIGVNAPFTSELRCEMKFNPEKDVPAKSVKDFLTLVKKHYDGALDPTAPTAGTLYNLTSVNAFFQKILYSKYNVALKFKNYSDANEITATLVQTVISPVVADKTDLVSPAWNVQLKFHGISDSNLVDPLGNLIAPGVWYPQLLINFDTLNDKNEVIASSKLRSVPVKNLDALTPFNEELKFNYEMLLLAHPSSPSPAPISSPDLINSFGKVADELSDGLANIANKFVSTISTVNPVQLQPSGGPPTNDLALWVLIKKGTEAMSFKRYFEYMDAVFCGTNEGVKGKFREKAQKLNATRALPFSNVDAYRSIKVATEAFVMVNCMVDEFTLEDAEDLARNVPLINFEPSKEALDAWFAKYTANINGGPGMLPYLAVIRRKLSDAGLKTITLDTAFGEFLESAPSTETGLCYGLLEEKLTHPCFLELIWSYWHEESMMVQGLKAIGRRFQNIKGPGGVDPLANLEIDPLRPLNNLMWGYIQDEQHLLSVRRRAYEYDHHYGISLQGAAVRNMTFADSRSKFIEAFHTLLNIASRFYRQADDMTVQPDGFPVLNALKENHLILSEGAHNQFGDLPSVARTEMLMEQWLLSRPEFREFLPTRIMVAYPEPWMDRVSALNHLMGWTKTSILHFRDLAVFGEQLLLSIRFGNWANENNRHAASNWARFWRPQVQSYIHAYRAATGVDLTADVVGGRIDALQPSVHLMRRLAEQRVRKAA